MSDSTNLFSARAVTELSATQLAVRDDLNRRIRSGEVKMEAVPCLCGVSSDEMVSLAHADRYGIDQTVKICCSCGLIMSNPRMTEADYRDFYVSDAYRLMYDGEGYVDHYERLLTPEQGQRILWSVQRFNETPKHVIEIGAGAGWNLIAFQNVGSTVVGWDYSPHLSALGRSHGISVRQGSIDEAVAEGTRYDVIILNHVLEHFVDPIASLRKLHDLANPGCALYVGVPATDYPSTGLLQSAHVYYFTDKTLVHYLAIAGWVSKEVYHEDAFGMHTVAFAGDCAPSSLTSEFKDTIARLRRNRSRVRLLENYYRARARLGVILDKLGLYTRLRTLWRRVQK